MNKKTASPTLSACEKATKLIAVVVFFAEKD